MRRVSVFMFLVLFFISPNIFSQDSQFFSEVEKARSFPNASVILTESWVKDREDLNTEYLESLDPDRLLHNFRINAGLPSDAKPLDGWEAPYIGLRGHFVGHYLSAVSSVVEKYKQPIFIQRLNYIISELYKCQQALGDGYLSAFPEKDFEKLETQFG